MAELIVGMRTTSNISADIRKKDMNPKSKKVKSKKRK